MKWTKMTKYIFFKIGTMTINIVTLNKFFRIKSICFFFIDMKIHFQTHKQICVNQPSKLYTCLSLKYCAYVRFLKILKLKLKTKYIKILNIRLDQISKHNKNNL